jgi:hypothetical protein
MGKTQTKNNNQPIIRFKMLNIRINEGFELSENVYVKKLSEEDIYNKYPVDLKLHGASELNYERLKYHNTEVSMVLENDNSGWLEMDIELQGYYLNKIINSLMLSGVLKMGHPYATHCIVENPKRQLIYISGINAMSSIPEPLTKEEIQKIINSYKTLLEAEKDSILNTSFERYIIALKRGNHHDFKLNRPNWDKIVDEVIALETLLLNGLTMELKYRFQLNGTTILSRVENIEKRKIFESLGHLYNLRSSIVHGEKLETIIKKAGKFSLSYFSKPDLDEEDLFYNIVSVLENWIFNIFKYLSSLKIEERPYSKNGNWEDWLWDN